MTTPTAGGAPPLSSKGPRGGSARFYTHPVTGQQFHSVTTILRVINKPALVSWAAKEVAHFAADNLKVLNDLGREARVDLLKGAPWRKSGAAANIGASIHAFIEANLDGTEPPMLEVMSEVDVEAYCAAALDFLANLGELERATSEITVFGAGWAGTCDVLLRMKDGRTIIVDWKTTQKTDSRGPWPESGLQIAAYAAATEAAIEDGHEWQMHPWPDPDEAWVVELRPNRAYRGVQVDWRAMFPAWEAARKLFAWQDANDWFVDTRTQRQRKERKQ